MNSRFYRSAMIFAIVMISLAFSAYASPPTNETAAVMPPIQVYIGNITAEIPDGFMAVKFSPASETEAKALWLRSFGSMDNYTFEKANEITHIVAKDGRVPCACQMEGAPYKYYPPGQCPDSDNQAIGCCKDECPHQRFQSCHASHTIPIWQRIGILNAVFYERYGGVGLISTS